MNAELKVYLEERRVVGAPDACWLWDGAVLAGGHGQVEVREDGKRKVWTAHRLAFFLEYGWLPEQVHHRCEVKLCVNPAHLEGLTLAEHQRRHRVKSMCVNGHDLTDPANIYERPDGGRQCRGCNRERQQRYRRQALFAEAAELKAAGL